MPTSTFCPSVLYSTSTTDPPIYTYSGYFCSGSSSPGTPGYCSDTVQHNCPSDGSGCCPPTPSNPHGKCPDAITPAYGGNGSQHYFLRKGVPNPQNPGHRPDEFIPLGDVFLLAEYTALWNQGNPREFRLFHLADVHSLSIVGLAWEVDTSPSEDNESPIYTPTFDSRWLSLTTTSLGQEIIQVRSLGEFILQTIPAHGSWKDHRDSERPET
jgi:hypothetical protein